MEIKLNLRTHKKSYFMGPFPVVIPTPIKRGSYIYSRRGEYARRDTTLLGVKFQEPVLLAIIPTIFKGSTALFSLCTVKNLEGEESHTIQLIT